MAKTLRDQLYHTLKTSIDHGYLESGLVLLEGSLANLFNMSRSPVRQTLGRLHDEGMICRFDGRGYQVGAFPTEAVRRSLVKKTFATWVSAKWSVPSRGAKWPSAWSTMLHCAP